jgi:hypothetical protein
VLGVNRAIPYMAIEVFGWYRYAHHEKGARRHRDLYRALASAVARSAFSADRPLGDFEYYERMAHYTESGAFDAVPGGRLDPESDTTTYNGAMWLLARRTFWSDVDAPPDTSTGEWKSAISFYQRRAYDDQFRWSWRAAPLQHADFRRLIGQSNDLHRRALQDVGIVIANHVLSTVDAYVTVRLRRTSDGSAGGGWEVFGALPMSRLIP